MSTLKIPRLTRQVTIKDYIPGQPIPELIRDPRNGRVLVNPLKKYVKPYTLSIAPSTITLAADGEPTDFIPMPLDGKGPFEVMQAFFKSQRAEGFTVQLFDPEHNPILMNREIHVGTIASGGGTGTNYEVFGAVGSAGRPFIWPETFFMNERWAGKCLFAVFRNLSTSSNLIRFALHGQKWYHMQATPSVAERMTAIYRDRLRTMPFFYTTDQYMRLSSLGDQEWTVRFTDEAWTEWSKSMIVRDDAFNVQILETVSRKAYMPQPLPDSTVFGSGEFPFLNWESAVYEPDFQLSFRSVNPLAETIDVWLTLGCRKIFPDPQDAVLLQPGKSPGVTQ